MRTKAKRLLSLLLISIFMIQLLPTLSLAAFDPNISNGDVLFTGENHEPRSLVSETTYDLTDGVTEYVTYTNEESGLNQNIDYFCEVDLSKVQIMAGYPGMDSILSGKGATWQMQGVSNQVKDAQGYYDRTAGYENYQIVAALNGDYYNMATGEPLGALVINGEIYHAATSGYFYFAIDKNGKALISDNSDLSNLQQAVGGSALLVKDGEVNVAPGGRNVTYTAIGIKADGNVVAMVCHGQSYPVSCGYTQYEVAQMMKARGCVDALLLDGSGSSTYVSRHEGEGAVSIRNSPSDGMERMTTSSIMIVSTTKSDGVFHHAAVEPKELVYTPGSSVRFTAIGADAAGGPAPLPSGLNWSIADSAFGTVDGKSGLFRSNGTCGSVTIQANYNGEVVGASTILIEQPDQLIFSDETVSIGFGDTSDLGLQARYEGRNIICKDGDLNWTISDDKMGRFEGNVFHASETASLTGTAKVTSVWDETVTATVSVEVGKKPLIAMDFEGGSYQILHGTTKDGAGDIIGVFESGSYTTDESTVAAEREKADMICVSYTDRNAHGQPQVGAASIVRQSDGAPVRAGNYALKLDYDFTDNKITTDGVCFGYNEDIVLEGDPTNIGIWVFVPEDTPNLWLRLRYSDNGGNTSQIDFTPQPGQEWPAGSGHIVTLEESGLAPYADGAWHYFEADIRSLQKPVTIPAGMSLRVMAVPQKNIGLVQKDGTHITQSECYGSLYFDNLTYIFGSNDEDTLPPVITSCTINGQLASDGMVLANNTLAVKAYAEDKTGSGAARFNTGLNLSTSHLYVDGYLLQDALSDSGEGSLRHDNIVLSNGEHVVKVVMTDNYGNETIKTWRVTVAAPGNVESPVTLSAGKAVVGETVTVDFTARSASDINTMEVSLHINKDYKNDFTLTPGPGYEVAEPAVYDQVSQTVSFALRRTASGNAGTALGSLRFQVPAGAAQGTSFSCYVTAGSVTFADGYAGKELGVFAGPVLTAEVASSYTVSSEPLVNGMPGQFFQVSDADGKAVAGVTLYNAADNCDIGTSNTDGRVSYSPTTAGNISVYAKDSAGNVSFVYTTTVYEAKGNADGTPTLIFTNTTEDPSSGKNISWLSNPLYANSAAVLQLAETEAGIDDGERRQGSCRLAGFATDKSAVYACGVTLTGLTEGKTYYYRVGDGEEGHWSPVRSFTVPYAGGDTDILIFGDLQEQNNSNITGILKSLNLSRFDLAIQTGDLVDNGGNYGYWTSSLENLAALDGMDRLNSLGNHEYEGGFDVSGLLYNRDKPYYSMTYGNTYIATIGYCGSTADYQEALNWLIQDAKQSTAAWKILVTHQPPYYTNTTGGNSGVNAIFPPAVESAGIDLVLSGHDHSYARTEPLKNGVVDEENGITYFICGSLGEKAYAATDNPNFHFAKMDDDFNAVYLTLSANENTLTVTAYDYNGGKSEVLDTWTKTRSNAHTHSYTWDGQNRLTCDCGYIRNAAEYTGYAFYTVDGKDGRVYLHLGVPQTGVFAAGDEVLHAGDDGLLHNSETVSTATCTEDGYLCCLCHDDNTLYQLSEKRYTGHNWDENHVCTNRVFSLETMQYEICGYHGRDISKLPVTLGYLYGFYTGEARRPSVTITDTLDNGTKYKLICQSTYGDCVPYYGDNIEVGRATIRIEGYGNYYGEQVVHFDIVPNNVKTIEAVEVTGNSVTLEWEPAKGAEEYIVYQNISGTWTRLGVTKENYYIATGLETGEQQFRIRPRTEVNGEYFHSTKNSDILTVQVSGNGITFSEGGRISKTYGDEPFINLASLKEEVDGFTYASSDPAVASVDAQTGEVTILRAGTVIITAAKDDLSGQYRLTIDPLTVGLDWSGWETRVYDGNASSVTATATGVLEGDSVQVTVSGGDARDAGTHTAQATQNNNNYALPTEQSRSYIITPRPLTLTWSNTELTYSGRELAPTASGNEVAPGDSVLFSVKGAIEPGTYKVTAVSTNPNYVVEDGQETTYTITMPEVFVTGKVGDHLTCYIDGTTIYVIGSAHQDVVVTAKNARGTASSTTVSESIPISSITLGNITYDVDASGLVKLKTSVNYGKTAASIDAALDEAVTAEVEAAIQGQSNTFSNIIAAIAGHAEQLAANVAPDDAENVTLTVSMQLSVTDCVPGEHYTVKIKPVFTIQADDVTSKAMELSNEYINAPVLVTLKLPTSITPNNTTYIRHWLTDGTIEYIKPTEIDTENGTVSFYTSSFSEFTVYNDARSVSILFSFEDGSVQTRTFDPADLGKPLPSDQKENAVFNGWTIDGKLYTALEETLLDSEVLLTAVPSFTSNSSGGGNISGGGGGGGGGSKPPEEEVKNPFTDVTEAAWFYDAVMYAYSNGLFQGVTDTTFEPVATMTRAMLVTVLYRMDGATAPTAGNPFTDVPANAWYEDAVVWAADKGLVNGYGGGLFGPDDPVTREQMASILLGYARQKGLPTEAGGDLSAFKDGDSVSPWALDGIRWAIDAGLMQGKDGGVLDPLGTATRAEVAAMLMRFHENVLTKEN